MNGRFYWISMKRLMSNECFTTRTVKESRILVAELHTYVASSVEVQQHEFFLTRNEVAFFKIGRSTEPQIDFTVVDSWLGAGDKIVVSPSSISFCYRKYILFLSIEKHLTNIHFYLIMHVMHVQLLFYYLFIIISFKIATFLAKIVHFLG